MQIIEKDESFMASEYYSIVKWVANADTNLFNLSFDDVLRIAFMSQYYRGKDG